MIRFENWNIRCTDRQLGYQYDNLTRSVVVTGPLPEGWRWELMVTVGDRFDILLLEPLEQGVGVLLTRDQMCVEGYYLIQLRGTRGEEVRHTNQIQLYVGGSMSGDAIWPTVPSEFTDLEQRVHKDAQLAEQAMDRIPQVIEGNWHVFNTKTGAYEDTGVYAGGDAPYIGSNGHWYVGQVDTGVKAQGDAYVHSEEFSTLAAQVRRDAQATGEDRAATEADRAAIAGAQEATAADRKATSADALATKGDREATAADALATKADREAAEKAVTQGGYMSFHVDERGNLIYQRSPNVDVNFALENGHLIMTDPNGNRQDLGPVSGS